MEGKRNETKRSVVKDMWRLALAIIGVIAIVQELRKPTDQRTWHGKVGDVIPYDFRMPSVEKFRQTYWNPDGPMVSSRVWGVGWAINIGAVKRRMSA